MRIASWNIAGGHTLINNEHMNYFEQLDYFIDELKKIDADIICLQEAHTSVDGKEIQAKIIADKLGYRHVENQPYKAKTSHIKDNYFLSISTISKLPISQSTFFELPNPNLKIQRPNGDMWITLNAGFLMVEINYEGKKVNIANTHLVPLHYFKKDYMEEDFKNIREEISKLLINLSKTPTVIAGDFNFADMKSLLPDIFKDNLYHDAFQKNTTPEKGQQDHILFSNHWQLKSADIKKGNADHYLCVADVEFKLNL